MPKLTFLTIIAIILSCTNFYGKEKSCENLNDSVVIAFKNITSHPRLLLTSGEESKIKKLISQDENFAKIHNKIIITAESQLNLSFLQYKVTGKRLLSVSREALKRIFYLSYAYRMTGKKIFADRAIQEMINVSTFPDWHPQHYLDVAEMSFAVSIGYDWLYNVLNDHDKETIKSALREKAIASSKLSENNSWLNAKSNWNQVCNGGILSAILATYEPDHEVPVDLIKRFLSSTKKALKAYDPDGNFAEGYSYWAYGTGYQILSLEMLNTAFKTDMGLSHYPGFLETRRFLMFMEGPSGQAFNHSDGSSVIVGNPFMFWLANESNDYSSLFLEKKLLQNGVYLNKNLEDRFLPIALIFGKDIDLKEIEEPKETMFIGHGETPIGIYRTNWSNNDKALYLGIKGGKAASSHGHMDAGSFVFDALGVRWATDLGSQDYNSLEQKGVDLFNMRQDSPRWKIYRLNNFSHNTITVNDKIYRVDSRAEIIKEYKTANEQGLDLDMTKVLGDDVKTAHRSIRLINKAFLLVSDSITSNDNQIKLTWRMVTPAAATIVNSKTIKLTLKNKTLLMVVDNPDVNTCIWSNQSENPLDEPNKGTIKVGFDYILKSNSQTVINVKLIPQN